VTDTLVAANPARTPGHPLESARRLILPLGLAQFICSFAGSNMRRSVSNLGSSFGAAIAGTIIVSVVATGNAAYAWAMAALAVIGLIGFVAALLLPAKPEPQIS
jgi:hypothetical protein